MKTIHVEVSEPYDVLMGRNLINQIGSVIQPAAKTSRVAVVTDDIVAGLYLEETLESLARNGYEACAFVFPNGEQSKNLSTLSDILEFLAEKHIRRNDTVLALGGGVVGDIAGFAAAVYMRGVSVIQVPTTLLSAVDSSVGGKTAVDLRNGKNLAGAFWHPRLVVCDIDILDRLPEDIFAEGMAEVIKCNVIRQLPVIDWIEAGQLKEHIDETVFECVALKRDVVEKDEFDVKGIRNILNVGHTFAHAIEKLSGYTVSHGRAVGTGLILEAELACCLGMCQRATADAIRKAVCHYGLAERIPWTPEELAEAMKSDKKNRDDRVVFELPRALGDCEEVRLDGETLLKNINDMMGRVSGQWR